MKQINVTQFEKCVFDRLKIDSKTEKKGQKLKGLAKVLLLILERLSLLENQWIRFLIHGRKSKLT